MYPIALMRLQSDFTTMMLEAQTVMNLRLMGMSGVIATPEGENARMIEEKTSAWMDAWTAGTNAMMAGQPAIDVMSAGMAPLNSTVHANRERLMK